MAGKNISITPTNAGIEISAAADGNVKTVNDQPPDPNGNVQLTAANVGARASDWMPTAAQVGALANNASVVYYTAQTLTDAQKTQARTNIGAGTITEIKVNGTSKGTSGSVNLTNMVTFASSQTATVAGTSKTTYTYNQPTGDSNTGNSNGSAYFPEGIIMGGTAASAGLVTRGICGVTTPDATTGACSKENLYINYDGNNDYQSNRQLVLQAGSVGSHYGNNLYQYAAARGDAVKSYCDATYAAKSHTHVSNDITDALTLIQGNNITLTPTANGLEISAAADGNEVVTLTGDQEVSGVKTFNAPTNSSGTEQATMKLKTANGGSITFGKEGNNSGSMIRLDQVDGTCRLRFRSSATAGAMVWEQPESGSAVYMDVSTVNFRNTSAVVFNNFKSAGYLYTDSNGHLKKGTMPTALKNPNSLTFGTKTYDGSSAQKITASDLGALTSHQDISGKQDTLVSGTNIKTINGNSILGSGDLTISGGSGNILVATNTTLGGIKPWRSCTVNSMYNNGTDAPVPDDTSRVINAISTKARRYYAIETDHAGRAYVNVPWTNTTYSNIAVMSSGGSSNGDGSSASYLYSILTNNSSTNTKLKIFCRRITDAFNSIDSKSISFTGVAFDKVPYVAIGVYGTNSYTLNNVNVFDVTKTGCKYRATSNNGAAGSAFYIIAIQPN